MEMKAFLDWRFIVAALIAVQFLVFAVRSVASKEPKPKEGLRSAEFALIMSAAVLIGGWFVAFGGMALVRSSKTTATKVEASVAASSARGSCASLRIGMEGGKVRSLMGEPDKREKEDNVRGPGSERWVYAAARCQVHLFENVVEFVD